MTTQSVTDSEGVGRSVAAFVEANETRVGLFLGAGASVPLGMPTTCDFFQALFGDDTQSMMEKAYPGFEDTQAVVAAVAASAYAPSVPKAVDLEVIWQHLERLISVTASPRACGGAGLFAGLLGTTYVPQNIAKDLGARLQAAESVGDRLKQTARELLSALQNVYGRPDRDRTRGVWAPFRDLLDPGADQRATIFTTNYDLVPEHVCNVLAGGGQQDYSWVVDGFHGGQNEAWSWQPDTLLDLNQTGVRIVKLHGSVHWYRLEGQLRRHHHDMPNVTVGGGELAVVPPVIGKPALNNEWSPRLYALLEAWVRHVPLWVVIGFSFRDERVRSIFEHALSEGTIRRCIIACPSESGTCDVNADLRRLVEAYPAPHKGDGRGEIVHLNRCFGDDETARAILSNIA